MTQLQLMSFGLAIYSSSRRRRVLDLLEENTMEKLARDFMTSDPACCRPHTMLDLVAKMMVQYNCGEIPSSTRRIGQLASSRIAISSVEWSPRGKTRWRIL